MEGRDIEELARQIQGRAFRPDREGYDEARRIWNARLDQRPEVILRCRGPRDVVAGVKHARNRDLLLAVRGGGHSYAGHGTCEGGILLDLGPMNRVSVDPEARTARVGAGTRWGRFDDEAQASGLATTGGTVSKVGVAGLTLGGGTGYGARKQGLAIDNLLAASVVTADGRTVRASEDENPDLFWALRGGGGNFGVVTSFDFRLHELGPEVLAGQLIFPFRDARPVLESYRDFMADAPDALDCYAFVLRIPPEDVFPRKYHGELAVDLVFFYAGDVSEGEGVARRLRAFGDPILDAVGPVSYTSFKRTFDEGLPSGARYCSRAHYLEGLGDAAIDTFLDGVADLGGPYTIVYFEPLGGAVGRVDPGATAFPHREARYSFHILAGWTDPGRDEEVMGWTRDFHRAMGPYSTGGVYVNLLGRDEEDRVPAAYGDNYDRLSEIKKRWDPDNLFRMNHTIEPGD